MSARKSESLAQARKMFERALLRRSTEDAENAVRLALEAQASPLEIHAEVIAPSQVLVGERWHEGSLSIAEEHIATQLSIDQLNRLRALIVPAESIGKRAVVGALGSEAHWIGARMVADYFYADGWEVDFLGSIPPIEDLVNYVLREKPDLLVLSVTLEADLKNLPKLYRSLHAHGCKSPVLVGGQVFADSKMRDSLPKGVFYSSEPKEALVLAREICGISNPGQSLEKLLIEMGRRIQARRKALALSQRELAERSDLDRAYISSIEGGKQNFSIGALYRLASALGLSVDKMLQE